MILYRYIHERGRGCLEIIRRDMSGAMLQPQQCAVLLQLAIMPMAWHIVQHVHIIYHSNTHSRNQHSRDSSEDLQRFLNLQLTTPPVLNNKLCKPNTAPLLLYSSSDSDVRQLCLHHDVTCPHQRSGATTCCNRQQLSSHSSSSVAHRAALLTAVLSKEAVG